MCRFGHAPLRLSLFGRSHSLSIITAYFVARKYTEPEMVIAVVLFLTTFLRDHIFLSMHLRRSSTAGRRKAACKEILELKDQFVHIAVHDLASSATAIKWGKDDRTKTKRSSESESAMFFNIRERNEQLITLARPFFLLLN